MTVSTRKLLEITRFELVFQLRRKSVWFFFAVFLIPLIGVTSERLKDADRAILFNAPLSLAESAIVWSLVALLIVTAVAADAATRDVQTRLEPLMHAAPVSPAAYLGGRFLGAFLLAVIMVSVVPLVLVLAPLLASGPEVQPAGPFSAVAHLQSHFLLTLPNAFVMVALLFAVATAVRHMIGSYACAAFLFAWTQFIAFVGDTLGHWNLAKLLDPFGFVSVDLMSQTWSPVELNERLIATDGTLLLNRLLWLGIASLALAVTIKRFDFGGDAGAVRWWQRGRPREGTPESLDAIAERTEPTYVPHAPRDFGVAARLRQTLAITRDSLREVATVWAWLLVPVLALRITGSLNAIAHMGAGTAVLPATHLLLAPGVGDDDAPPLVLAMIMFPVLVAGEMIWRERDANMQALADAMPVPDRVRFVGKLLALCLVFATLYALSVTADVFTQVLRGWYDFEPVVYFQIVGLRLVQALVLAVFGLSVHVLVNQKHVAHLITLAAVVAPRIIAEMLRLEHPLLILGYGPSWRYSPISGFGPVLPSLLSFQSYWVAWVVLLALVAWLFWVRGVERGFIERLRLARLRLNGRMAGAFLGAIALVALTAGFVFYNTNILNAYERTAESTERGADYERTYGRFRNAPQPQIAATELNIELYPGRREADVRGVHVLVNRTAQAIDTIQVAISRDVDTGEIDFGRPARAEVLDDELSHRIYVLEEPLQPGDSLRLSWQVRHHPRGFPARGISTAVVGNGSMIELASWMPLIGYQRGRELSSAGDRREHGLSERPAIPSLDDVQARSDRYGIALMDLDVTVGTAADQIAVAPGELQETSERDGRRYFHYVSDAPIGLGYAIFSAEYAVREARWGDVVLQVFYHPEHDLNVDRIIRGMQASLEQLTERFGPYPYKVLRFVEYPSGGGSLHATTGTIWYEELFALFDPDHEPRRIDLPFAVTGHEVAHNFQPVPASVEGRSLLSESFAWYAALGVIEQEYGAEHLARFLDFMRETYSDPRSRADVPLLRASDFFLGYRKGPFAMYALQEYVGRDSVDLAWRRLRAQHASFEPPFATSLDLYRELQAVTPDSLQGLLADLIERNTFWELQATEAAAEQTASGEWQVTLDVSARKVAVDTAGVETVIPMDDPIEIGVYAASEGDQSPGRQLYRAMHHIGSGPQTITITVPERPVRAGIDPRHLLIDVTPSDNLVDIPDP